MGTSLRRITTQEERLNMIIEKENNKSPQMIGKTNKLSEYLSQENVKEFNRIMVDKALTNRVKNNRGMPQAFDSEEELKEEIAYYFKCCEEYQIIPTISNMVLFLGIDKDTLYASLDSNVYKYSYHIRNAIQICQGFNESAFLSGAIPPLSYIFLSKNYYGMQDNTNVIFNNSINDNTTNQNQLSILKEQLCLDGEYEEK